MDTILRRREYDKISALALGAAALIAFTGGAMAADLSMPVKAAPAPVVAAASDWDGAYIGANVGYAWGHSDHTTTTTGDFDLTGGFIGGQVGYNFHLTDGIVLGLQGDLAWANITGSQTGPSISDTIKWDGAVTGKLGYDAGDFMPYVLGGVAFANSDRTGIGGTVNETHTGWTVGAGVEAKLADHLSGFVEYRYSDYGQATYTGLASTPVVDLTSSAVRAGLNYHF